MAHILGGSPAHPMQAAVFGSCNFIYENEAAPLKYPDYAVHVEIEMSKCLKGSPGTPQGRPIHLLKVH